MEVIYSVVGKTGVEDKIINEGPKERCTCELTLAYKRVFSAEMEVTR